MPIFNQTQIEEEEYSFKIKPILSYRYNDLDLTHTNVPPLSKGKNGIHLLGTDKIGRDVAAGMVNGASVALIISITSIFLSLVFGLFIGLIIGYYGDHGIKKNLIQQSSIYLGFVLFFYYFLHLLHDGISIYSILPIVLIFGCVFMLDKGLAKLPFKKYGLPMDIIVQRLFEIQESVPGLFIILAFLAIIVSKTIFSIPIILAILYWMNFARHARAETLHIKEEAFIQAAKASGTSDFRLLIKHILPNAMPPIFVIIAFSFSSVILVESTLSFLGLGLPVDEVSWGKILSEARKYPKLWWLAVFPGLAIFFVLFAFNTLGDLLSVFQRKQE